MPNDKVWWDSHQTLVEVGYWLVDECLFDAREVLAFFEKPWKYEAEWFEYLADRQRKQVSEQERRARRTLLSHTP